MTEKTYKAQFRLVTGDAYEYMEVTTEGTPEGLVEQFEAFKRVLKVGEGLPRDEWNKLLGKYVAGKGMEAEQFERMNSAQRWWVKEWDKLQERKPTK